MSCSIAQNTQAACGRAACGRANPAGAIRRQPLESPSLLQPRRGRGDIPLGDSSRVSPGCPRVPGPARLLSTVVLGVRVQGDVPAPAAPCIPTGSCWRHRAHEC